MAGVPTYIPENHNGIMFLGEAPGVNEEREHRPFVGASGKLLEKFCNIAGIDFQRCIHSNVINQRPVANKIEYFCVKKDKIRKDYPFPLYKPGQYFPLSRGVA